MELLDRYLQSVKFFLPRDQGPGVIAELSEDIRSQVDARQAELGRPPTHAEVEAILQRWGQPMAVAERYLPQRYLIGPALHPIYGFVLKLIAGVYLVPWALVFIGMLVFNPAYRDAYLGSGLIDVAWNFGVLTLALFAVVTLIFAGVERRQLRARADGTWHPRQLLGARDPNVIPLFSSVVDLVVYALFALWWLDLRRVPALWSHTGPGDGIALASVWSTLYWPIWVEFVANVALAVFDLIRPTRTRLHAALRLANAAYCLTLVGLLLCTWPLVEITAPGDPAKAAKVETWFTLPIAGTLAVIGLWCVWEIFVNARRILRGQR